jgi:ribosomal protein S14
MKYSIRNIIKERIIRKNLTKKDILYKIIKSISQNNNINNNIKIYLNYILKKKNSRNNILSRKHKVCLYTGKRSGILKGFNFSRYTVKRFILENKLTNLKQNNW